MYFFLIYFFFTFLVPIYFRCLRECCSSVLLWISRNVLWTTQLHPTFQWQGGELLMIDENDLNLESINHENNWQINEKNHQLQPCLRGCAAVVSTNKLSNRFCSRCLFRACRTPSINTKGQHGRDWALVPVIKRLLVTPLWDPSQEKAEISGGNIRNVLNPP